MACFRVYVHVLMQVSAQISVCLCVCVCVSAPFMLVSLDTKLFARTLTRASTHAGGQRQHAFWLFFGLREALLFCFRVYVDHSWIASWAGAAMSALLYCFQELHTLLFFEIELDRPKVPSLHACAHERRLKCTRPHALGLSMRSTKLD